MTRSQRPDGSADVDDDAKLDAALRHADDLLMDSLQNDDRRRGRRKLLYLTIGGLLMTAILASAVLAIIGAAQENLIKNAGFEEGAQSPSHWKEGAKIPGVKYIWDKRTGKGSKSSLCLHKTANRYFPIAQWYQDMDVASAPKSIHISAQVKAQEVTKSIIDVVFLDAGGEWIRHEWVSYIGPKESGSSPHSHDWKKFEGEVQVPAGTKQVRIGLQIYGPGKVWFDELHAVLKD